MKRRLGTSAGLIGLFVQIPHPVACEVAGRLGFDFVCIEAEHSAMSVETVQALVSAAELTGSDVLVRLADGSPSGIAAALDAGADGVIVPRVSSAAEAAAVVRAARYAPVGERGVGPGRATGYGLQLDDYVARANDEVLVAIQVETKAGFEALDGILAVDGLDLVFVGPGDLALSLGIPGGIDSPRLREVVEEIVVRIHEAGRCAGTYADSAETVAYWAERRVELLVVGSDIGFLVEGGKAVLERLRALRRAE